MKIKELKRTVNVSWSPAEQYPIMLATGSAAQQVDANFNSNSYLELYSLNLGDPGLDLELKSSLQTQHKFHKLVWSSAGVVAGGCDGGLLQFYNADKLLSNSDALLGSSTKHSGHVSALDVNPYQKNLLASGASESEIFIWDLNNTSQPMAPGNRSQPHDHVQGLAWNQQVQHILGSTFATRCVVWDLRKNEPIMKLSDSQSRTRWRALAWHPAVATQLCVASEDDQAPVIQLWDLRLAASPLVTLEGHGKGVMALSWCRQEPALLLSAGKDGRLLCWDPNNTRPGGELLCEVWQQPQWVLDVCWCARDPALLAAASFDQQLAVHSLLAGTATEMSPSSASNIMDSFGGAASFQQLPAVQRAEPLAAPRPHLPRAPAWLRRPAAARFAFGGKLVWVEAGSVLVAQLVTEPELLQQAAALGEALDAALDDAQPHAAAPARLAEYCRLKGEQATDQDERYTWYFLRANFLPNFRSEALNLLGFKLDEIPSKFKSGAAAAAGDALALSRGESTETDAELSTDTSTDLSDAHPLLERKLANLDLESTVSDVVIPNGEDATSLICRALVCGNLEEAVELCLSEKRTADALVIASLGGPELLERAQRYHVSAGAAGGCPVALVAGALLHGRWERLVRGAAPRCWRETLAALLTHCAADQLPSYCEMLGERLSREGEPALARAAAACYLCAASPAALRPPPRAGTGTGTGTGAPGAGAALGPAGLARRAELALLARQAAAARGRDMQGAGVSELEGAVCEYAWRVAAQGGLRAALRALRALQGRAAHPLRDRLLTALGERPHQQQHQARHTSHPAPQPPGARSRAASGHSDVTSAYNPGLAYGQQPQQPAWQPPRAPSVGPPSSGLPSSGLPSSGLPSSGLPSSGLPSSGLPSSGLPSSGLPSSGLPNSGPPVPTATGLTSRSKYKVDPSVQTALHNQYNFNNRTNNTSYNYNSPLPDQYNSSSVPTQNSYNSAAPINNPYNTSTPMSAPYNAAAPINTAFDTSTPYNNPSSYPGAVNGGYYAPPQAPLDPAPPAPPAPSKPVPPGWNDPPMMSSSKPKAKQEVQQQAPITHPLFGVEPPQHVPLNPAQQYPAQQYPGQQYPAQQYPAQPYPAQQYPGQQYPPQQNPLEQHNQGYPPAMSPAYPPAAESPAPPAAAPKPALPEQHAQLQAVFDALRAECAERAPSPQMKRKLDDVQRRLETLYDMLREYKLSESALSSLHVCAQHAQGGDFPSALQVATALATTTDFAAVASFLPGLKTLFQLATQLQSYAR